MGCLYWIASMCVVPGGDRPQPGGRLRAGCGDWGSLGWNPQELGVESTSLGVCVSSPLRCSC